MRFLFALLAAASIFAASGTAAAPGQLSMAAVQNGSQKRLLRVAPADTDDNDEERFLNKAKGWANDAVTRFKLERYLNKGLTPMKVREKLKAIGDEDKIMKYVDAYAKKWNKAGSPINVSPTQNRKAIEKLREFKSSEFTASGVRSQLETAVAKGHLKLTPKNINNYVQMYAKNQI